MLLAHNKVIKEYKVMQGALPKTKRLDPREILAIDSKRLGGDWQAGYVQLQQAVKNGTTRVMRYGNTLFIYEILGQGQAEVHMATADTAKGIVKAIVEFCKAMKIAGFTKLVTDIDNPKMFKLFDLAKVEYVVTAMPGQGSAQNAVEIHL